LAKAITANLAVTTADAQLFADDAVDETVSQFVSGTVTVGANDLTPENQALVLGQTIGADGILYAGSEDSPPYGAIGFRAKKPSGQFLYVWLLKARFKVPSESYETKGSAINFHTPSLEADFITRKLDNNWRAQYVGDESDVKAAQWFNAVPVPTEV